MILNGVGVKKLLDIAIATSSLLDMSLKLWRLSEDISVCVILLLNELKK